MAGGSDQWSVWFDQYSAALILFARQWVSSYADAEDVVQEAFVRFWRFRDRATDPVAYLYTSVKNFALDWQRGRRRRNARDRAAARPEAETWFASPVEQNERRDMIIAALGSLPEEQREVLVMKIWGGLSFPQIAEGLRISANTVASRYRYALAKLRERLAEEPIHD